MQLDEAERLGMDGDEWRRCVTDVQTWCMMMMMMMMTKY